MYSLSTKYDYGRLLDAAIEKLASSYCFKKVAEGYSEGINACGEFIKYTKPSVSMLDFKKQENSYLR